MTAAPEIRWDMSPAAIEVESFATIEREFQGWEELPPAEWKVMRRLIHTTADLSIGEGLAFPEMRDWFFEHSVAPAHARLAEYFARQVHLGTLAIADPVIAADQFYMALFGGAIIRSVNGITSADELERLRADARAAALVFLHGVLPR